MERLRPAWEALSRGVTRSIFQDFAWNHLAARVFADREAPFVVYSENSNGAALIPAAICRDGTLIVLLGETLFDYRTVLTHGDPSALAAAWQEIGNLRQQLWVSSLPEDWRGSWHDWEPRPFSAAPALLRRFCSSDAFAHQHPGIRRSWRRLQEREVKLERYSGADTAITRQILQCKARQLRNDPNNLFADCRRIEFLTAAFALDPGSADIFTLERGSQLVAALITLRDRHVRRFYTTYHDVRWGRFSPGVVLLYEVTRQSLAEGLDCDYMTGTQPHKMRLANTTVRLYRVDATPEQVGMRAPREPALAA